MSPWPVFPAEGTVPRRPEPGFPEPPQVSPGIHVVPEHADVQMRLAPVPHWRRKRGDNGRALTVSGPRRREAARRQEVARREAARWTAGNR